MQAGDFETARELMRQALRSGANRQLAARLLVGSVYTSLGRASMLAERPERGVRQLSTGLDLGVPGGSALWLDLLMAEAERCTRRGDDREAIQRWQDIACLLGARTPEHVYQRLSDAYARNREGFGGTPDENHLWGDCDKHDLLAFMHEQLQPRLYLEIGVDEGASLTRARGRAIGVDPRPKLALKHPLNEHTTVISLSSDAFFREHAAALLQPPPDLVFIDGMHLFEFALRDFMNAERHAHPATLIVIDDIYPCHPTQATRRRRSDAWTGDIWKLHQILRERRPDLTLIALNAHTTGLLLIAGLDPDNRVLWDDYEAIVQRHRDERAPPPAVLERHGAIASDHAIVLDLLKHLKQARAEAWNVAQVRSAIGELKPALAAAEQAFSGLATSLIGQCHLTDNQNKPPQEACHEQTPILPIKRLENGHILISGTGRSGTTLLVQIFTHLGLDTGFSCEDVFKKVDAISAAGLEHGLLAENKPYIIKSPWFSDEIETALSNGLNIDCLIVPMRDLFAAAESRRRVFEENARLGKDPVTAPGSLWKTDDPKNQEPALAMQFYKLLRPIIERNTPIIFLSFPKFAYEFEYFYSTLKPVFNLFSLKKTEVKHVFDQVVDIELIHDFDNSVSVNCV